VWAVTARIPAGEVRTYAWVARELGSKGYRAVGNALNRNPYAPVVPCHRVVGSNGSLTGFAGGLEKKRKLLLGEGVVLLNGRVVL
jgi:methylated-DNA-[protein]-cysteine S-methyltransferase